MGRHKVIKDQPGIQREETENYIEDILNDPKDFDPTSFRTHKMDEKSKVVYGKRIKDGKQVIHKIQTRK